MKKLLRPFFTWLADKVSSRPNATIIHASLTDLYESIIKQQTGGPSILNPRTGKVVPFDSATGRFIIFSDQHKGCGDRADDFNAAHSTYRQALDYYYENGYTLINLGDSEELWENKAEQVLEHYKAIMLQEAAFERVNRYWRVFGNHDILWFGQDAVKKYLQPIFSGQLKVYEGILLSTTVGKQPLQFLLTHGHQGDAVSDSNAFSKWFVGRIWVPIQRWLDFNVNTPAKDFGLRDRHNHMMYQWTEKRQHTILITGHTHKPVFQSLSHLQRLAKQLEEARQQKDEAKEKVVVTEIKKKEAEYGTAVAAAPIEAIRPSYYNAGCCCFNDGDITGIEIADGILQLVRWHTHKETKIIERQVCEKESLETIAAALARPV